MSGNDVVEALHVGAGAVRQRLERFAGELHQRFGQVRAVLDHAVEGASSEIALQLQELGRALRLGERADRVGRLLERVAALGDDALADRLGASGGDSSGFDERVKVGAIDVGELFGGLAGAARRFLATAGGVGENLLESGGAREGPKSGI